MRPSWKANLLAAITIGVTLFVGALGAQGGPKQQPSTTATPPSLTITSDHTSSADSRAVPRCRGRLASVGISFACPSGWFVWENDHFTDDPYQRALIIVANHRPLARADDDLPDGWFKTDIYVATRNPKLTFTQVARETCS